jgi:hypothetical protein
VCVYGAKKSVRREERYEEGEEGGMISTHYNKAKQSKAKQRKEKHKNIRERAPYHIILLHHPIIPPLTPFHPPSHHITSHHIITIYLP